MFEQFRKAISVLKKETPAAFPVEVRRIKLKGFDGYCTKPGNKFAIRINKDLGERMAIETLLHEWAHALRWDYRMDNISDEEFQERVHDAAWGVFYAEVYRKYEKSISNE